MSVPEKRKSLQPIINKLFGNNLLKLNDDEFNKKIDLLKYIVDCWRQQIDINLLTNVPGTEDHFKNKKNSENISNTLDSENRPKVTQN